MERSSLTSSVPSNPSIRFSPVVALVARHRRFVLLGMLVLLHLVITQGGVSAIARMLLVGHFGLFLLWQPIVRAERRLKPLEFTLLATAVTAGVVFLNGWLLIGWTMVVAAIVGGKVFFYGTRWSRLFYLLALAYLLIALLVLLIPQVLPPQNDVPGIFDPLARYVSPVLFLVMAILPVEEAQRGETEVIDLFSSIILFLLLAVLLLGCLAFMQVNNAGYVEALLLTLLSLAGVLFLLGWAWNPRAGFSGVGVLFTRYVLSVGLPFEQWMHYLADHAMREDDPLRFLDEAFAGLARLPWVAGGRWEVARRDGEFGEPAGARSEFQHGPVKVTLYTRQKLSPALQWHFDLLSRLLGEFYLAKVHAAQLQQMSYVQAVHETGARLTHDVKNLLQSLNTLCFAATQPGADNSPEFQTLLRRQLPAITQRLEQTLDKLRRPGEASVQTVPAVEWWSELKRRYASENIEFSETAIDADLQLPAATFNTAAENMLQNALDKRAAHGSLNIRVHFCGCVPIKLSVSDDGSAMPDVVAGALFHGPLPSANGFGIGLYHAAREASLAGYELELTNNEPGKVCLSLLQLREELADKPAADARD